MPYSKIVRVLFESSDRVLSISTTGKNLYVTANDGTLMITKGYPVKSRWETACKPAKLLNDVKALVGSRYTIEIQERHEEFLDDLISYWEE